MQKEQIKKYTKYAKIAVGVIIAIVLLKSLFGYNSATQLLVKQSPTGTLSCVDHAGLYFKGFASIYSYDRTKDFYFNSSTEKVKGEGWEGGEDDEDDISVTLSRNAKMEPTADSILFEEIAEAFNAYQHGDKKQALKELAQVGAVVFRCMEFIQKEMEAET